MLGSSRQKLQTIPDSFFSCRKTLRGKLCWLAVRLVGISFFSSLAFNACILASSSSSSFARCNFQSVSSSVCHRDAGPSCGSYNVGCFRHRRLLRAGDVVDEVGNAGSVFDFDGVASEGVPVSWSFATSIHVPFGSWSSNDGFEWTVGCTSSAEGCRCRCCCCALTSQTAVSSSSLSSS